MFAEELPLLMAPPKFLDEGRHEAAPFPLCA
jgi:hypothetical protein